jgi:2'-hydroxyisoflavone reductase
MMTVLKILILGGTTFLGPHLVQELQQRGHEVTIFTRGNQSSKFSNVEELQGDRDGNLEALKNRNWDAIIDTSGHLPRLVKDSSKLLTNSTNHYTFISTIGVYENFYKQKIDEEYPVARLENENSEEITEKNYGALKAACEEVIQSHFPNRCTIIRPGLIVGPLDPTARFSYWPTRVKRGGEILASGSPNQLLQIIDVRDLAKWIVTMVEQQAVGIYNVTGPAKAMNFEQLLQECQAVTNAYATLTWVNEDFLIKHQIQDWVEIPLWLSYTRNMPGFLNVSIDKALKAGLTLRPIAETIKTILDENNNQADLNQSGLNPEKERMLLNQWHHSGQGEAL